MVNLKELEGQVQLQGRRVESVAGWRTFDPEKFRDVDADDDGDKPE